LRRKQEVKILVKDGAAVVKNSELFAVGKKIFKARKAGVVKLEEKLIKVVSDVEKVKEYIVPKGFGIWVHDGDEVKIGDQLTEGSLDLHQLYQLRGKLEAQKYIIKEIQYVYSSQGQPLNDKHIEIIARQMFARVYISDAGDTELLPGEIVEKAIFDRTNEEAKTSGKKQVKGEQLLLGITKSSLTTNSFRCTPDKEALPSVAARVAWSAWSRDWSSVFSGSITDTAPAKSNPNPKSKLNR